MLLKQLYIPIFKINFKFLIFRLISKIIIFIFFIDKNYRFSNSFQQILSTAQKINFRNKVYSFKDGNERLYWRHTTQFKEEIGLCNWIDTFNKKDIFCDIGSNVGMFTIYAAKKKILTYSIEPHPSNLDKLHWNIFLNNVSNFVIVMPITLFNKNGCANFCFRDLTSGVAKNFLGKSKNSKINFKYLFFNFDEIIKKSKIKFPNKVKIDVDGNELEILYGMKNTLKIIDEIYIEMYTFKKKNSNYNKIINFLKKNKFEVTKKFEENYIFKKNIK